MHGITHQDAIVDGEEGLMEVDGEEGLMEVVATKLKMLMLRLTRHHVGGVEKQFFYHTNGFGDSVLFDSLGSPWEVHSCWKNYWNQERSQRPGREHSNSVENSLILQTSDIEQRNRLIFTGAIKHLRKTQILITEIQVANYLGFSLEIFREIFFHLYFYSSRLGNTYVIRMR